MSKSSYLMMNTAGGSDQGGEEEADTEEDPAGRTYSDPSEAGKGRASQNQPLQSQFCILLQVLSTPGKWTIGILPY